MNGFLEWVDGSKKAIVAMAIAMLGAAVPAAEGGFTVPEVLTILLAGVLALGGVYGITNTGPKAPQPKP